MDKAQLVRISASRRGQVTKIYNGRDEFRSLTTVQKSVMKSKLKSLCTELQGLNNSIQQKVVEKESDEELINEIETSDRYFDNIQECIVLLDDIEQSTADVARSLLKSPVAPLPKFYSKEGEDLNKFLRNFEDTTQRFKYSDYDRFLLLKQQVTGRALKLIESLEADKQSYSHAKSLLISALASPIIMK